MSTRHSSLLCGQSASLAGLLLAAWLLLAGGFAFAQAPAAPAGAALAPSQVDLDKLVGPIALYPDDLVAIILPAATLPLQIVQADRFLEKRKADKNLAVDAAWDDAVKSLLNYPDVVKKMSTELDWTSALGDAVIANQAAVLEAVQRFRRQTQAAGNLKTDDKQVIVVEKEVIKIVPADPQVVYVPTYNPATVVTYGYPYAYYPAPYPAYAYPYAPGAAMAAGVIWGAAIGAAWSGNHYGANYGGGGNTININNSNNANVNRNSTTNAAARGGNTTWQPQKGSGSQGRSAGASQTGASSRVGDTSGGRASGGRTSGAGASTQPASRQGGGASAGTSDFGGGNRSGGDALGGYGSGSQARADSSRGASSRDSMSTSNRGGGSSAGGGSRGGGGSSGFSGGGGGSRGGGGGGGSRGGRGGGGRR